MNDFFAVLKPGGVLGVEEHRADPRPELPGISDGYMSKATVVAAAEKAGFSNNDEWLGVEWGEGGKKGGNIQAWRLNKVDDLPMMLGKQKLVTALVSRDKRLLRLPLTIPTTSTTARIAVKDAKAVLPWMTGNKT